MSDNDRLPLKWPVPLDGKFHDIGTGDVLLVGVQDHEVYVWTEECAAIGEINKKIGIKPYHIACVFATGEPALGKHLGSVQDGPYVWHVYGQRGLQ